MITTQSWGSPVITLKSVARTEKRWTQSGQRSIRNHILKLWKWECVHYHYHRSHSNKLQHQEKVRVNAKCNYWAADCFQPQFQAQGWPRNIKTGWLHKNVSEGQTNPQLTLVEGRYLLLRHGRFQALCGLPQLTLQPLYLLVTWLDLGSGKVDLHQLAADSVRITAKQVQPLSC